MKVGQLYAVDMAYKHVKTEYIFHLEDDFLFIGKGMIEKSLKIMKAEPMISQVILRSWNIQGANDSGRLDPVLSNFSAFSFNPSLKRMKEYRLFLNSFGGFS